MKRIFVLIGIFPLIIVILMAFISGCQKQDSVQVKTLSVDYLTIDNAILEVEAFMKRVEPTVTRSYAGERRIASYWVKSLDSDEKSTNMESPKLYIINYKDSSGFAIVSNDPYKGVLGLSFSGTLAENEPITNPGLAIIMEHLEAYAKIPSRVDSIDHYEYGPWQDVYYAPNTGYCPVKWSQGIPSGNQFNAYCPTINDTICPTGCTAVAVAQLMAMYQYPSSYGSYYFNWNSMISNSAATDFGGNYYVGRLLQQLGLSQNLDISYGTCGSSAYVSNIPRTLENFGFTNGGNHWYFYSAAIQDLKAGYPIIMNGEASIGGGHTWLSHGIYDRTRVCIGYSSSGEILLYGNETLEYVLHNFGWGGYGDGYYILNNYNTLNGPAYNDPNMNYSYPGSYDFTSSISCIYGIRL